MTDVTGFAQHSMTLIMVLVGAGMVFGNYIAGRLADRYSSSLVTAIIASMIIVVMPMIYFLSPYKLPSLLCSFIAPALLFGLGGPLQYLIVRYAKGGEMLGGAGIQIAFNVSNAMAAAIGGAVIRHGFGLASPALAGVPFAIISAISLFTLYHLERTTRAINP